MSKEEAELENNGKDRDDSKMNPVFQKTQSLSVLIIGLGIGWLAGLSVSAIVSSIITSLLGLGAGLVAGLQTIQRSKENNFRDRVERYFDARPAALLVLGIALAAPCGIMVRTYHVFEPSQSGVVINKTQAGSLEKSLLNELLILKKEKQDQGVLFSQYEEECSLILSLATMGNYSAFMQELKRSKIPAAEEMVFKFQDDPESLEFFLKTICRFYKSK